MVTVIKQSLLVEQMRRIAEATWWLEDEATAVSLVAQVASTAAPGCIVKTYTVRGFPGRALGAARHFLDGDELPEVEGCRTTFSTKLLPVMKQIARRGGGWTEAVRDGVLTSNWLRDSLQHLPHLSPLGVLEWGFFSASIGAEPVGGVSLLVPGGRKGFSDAERELLRKLVPSLARSLRLAALVANGVPGLHALDHLLSSRADAVFLASPSGHLLAASPAGERLLLERPRLAGAVGNAVRANRAAAGVSLSDGIEIHVSPCSPRGGAPAFMALVSPAAPVGRRRLTSRQLELVELVAEGLTNREVAERMGLTPATVKTMLERMYRQAGVSGRVSLLRWAQPDARGRRVSYAKGSAAAFPRPRPDPDTT